MTPKLVLIRLPVNKHPPGSWSLPPNHFTSAQRRDNREPCPCTPLRALSISIPDPPRFCLGLPMSRHRDSARFSEEEFSVRWHSLANMATPSADIMSSPDPLNDSAISSILQPSSQRVTRSQRSNRFMSLGLSPRKQTFELEVGDNKSPQKLLVTVETGDGRAETPARRKLFQSPSPVRSVRPMTRTTTTTVPLRESIEVEEAGAADPLATPKRRGRPRKSNGTPMPSAGKKRRAGTPIRRTPRRPRSASANAEDAPSEASIQATPKSGRRGRPPKKTVAEPPSEAGNASTQKATFARRGRRRRQALAPEELEELADDFVEHASFHDDVAPSENDMELVRAPSDMVENDVMVEPTPPPEVPQTADADAGSDVWMATGSNDATPRASRQTRSRSRTTASPAKSQVSPELGDGYERPGTEDYGYLPPASDVSSADENDNPPAPIPNDTIAQGEDFSMIFMDSIPSLQASLSAPAPIGVQSELGDETNLIINNTLESLRQEAVQDEEDQDLDVFEEINSTQAENYLEREEPIPSLVLPAEHSSPDRVLSPRLARSPRKANSSPLRQQVLKFNARQAEGAAASGSHMEDTETTTRPAGRRLSARLTVENPISYEDSFSEIPQDILEAATPAKPSSMVVNDDLDDEMDLLEEEPEEEEEPAEMAAALSYASIEIQAMQSPAATVARSDASRLPTPDNTPPHEDEEIAESPEKPTHTSSAPSSRAASVRLPTESISEPRSQVSQSPANSSRLSEERIALTEATPVNQMSSPVEQAQSLLAVLPQDRTRRPTLSPIVRAGRALQSVTSDPPSPEGRDSQLRSPFRSSGSKESWQGSKDVFNERQATSTPPQWSSVSRPQSASGDRRNENPFAAIPKAVGQANFMQALGQSPKGAKANPVLSRDSESSSNHAVRPDDEMSWIADEGPISPNLRGDISLQEAARTSTRRVQSGSVSSGQIDGTADQDQDHGEEADDETDIWEIEAQRETPRSIRQQPFGKKNSAPLSRRGAVPSPWAKEAALARPDGDGPSATLSQSARLLDTAQQNIAPASEIDEFSMLTKAQTAQEAKNGPEAPPSASKSKGFDLSSFFSSPAAIPGMLAGKLFSSKPKPNIDTVLNKGTPAEATISMPTTSMFPQIPQSGFQIRRSPRRAVASPVHLTVATEEEELHSDEGGSSPATPDAIEMPPVAQKQDFTPRPRQASQSFFQPSSAAIQTPPRMQLSHEDIERWQQETSNESDNSPEMQRRLLRPLPPKNASPSKSSLRSPLKPRTPGRVVEFTSSVLSPVEQAQARHQRAFNVGQSLVDLFAQPTVVAEEPNDKENQEASDVSMTDASPLAKMSHPVPLSQTVWSREHWLFLDELLQLRRDGPLGMDYERRADKYLGKTVKSQGEAMKLERWHLDCVDAFKAEVGGWDEGIIAKRLFALIVGEERRKLGALDEPARVMFH